jgi:hypothetical protein
MALPSTIPRQLGEQVRPDALAGSQRLAVLPPLEALLPQGLARGSVVVVGTADRAVHGATSLALALAAGAAGARGWVAVVGGASLGLVAAHGLGVPLERLVVVEPGSSSRAADVVAALVDGFDVVLLGAEARSRLGRSDVRRLQARARERGALLVGMGGDLPGGAAQVRLTITASAWEGLGDDLGDGPGHLLRRRVTVEATGRGAASRPRRAELWLPGPDGTVEAVVREIAELAS